MPSELSEDEIKICVVVQAGEELAPEELIEFLVPRMPRFMVPRYVELVDALPKTAGHAAHPQGRAARRGAERRHLGSGGEMTTGTKRRPYRRDEILAAAVKLFHERGYHATGMDDIGAEAGISGPAIYRHFKGKEEILEVLLLDAAQTGLESRA